MVWSFPNEVLLEEDYSSYFYHAACITFLSALGTFIHIGKPQFSLMWRLRTLIM